MNLKTLERALLVDEVRVVLFAELLVPSALVGLLRLLLLRLRCIGSSGGTYRDTGGGRSKPTYKIPMHVHEYKTHRNKIITR
jgi:hypothetical protein